ncbi:immunity 17 family protein [Cellulophaga sp. HaHaR_3_176]|uniref:immunity 17 family protein n=1 Tax=Cellulophaga sp. HaHaR_3_176 TaxID=1942464 RepID=UPI001C1F550E|nr:immunity 17 family protein [Cellulophaga sp. HaHaR_3_176]QWX83000.1 immunity 17 family protein [Cellulophaga sp. HaHaR_3_176]
MEEKFQLVVDFFQQNPGYAYLLLSAVFLVYGIGNLINKDWAIDPANSTQKFNYEIFGHNAFRFVKGFLFILGAIAGIVGFFSTLD